MRYLPMALAYTSMSNFGNVVSLAYAANAYSQKNVRRAEVRIVSGCEPARQMSL
jgi:hypothetical protein